MGLTPVPTNLKLIKGTARKCRLNKKEPKPRTNAIRRPPNLTDEAAKLWPKICRELKACGVMTNLDVVALGMFCEVYARWNHATEKCKSGLLIKTTMGVYTQSPYLDIADKCFDQMRKMLIEFGMTPASRTKVQAVTDDKKDDPWEQF